MAVSPSPRDLGLCTAIDMTRLSAIISSVGLYLNAENPSIIVQTHKPGRKNCLFKYNGVISMDPFPRKLYVTKTVIALWLIISGFLRIFNPTPFKENKTRFLDY